MSDMAIFQQFHCILFLIVPIIPAMNRKCFVIVAVLVCLSLRLFAQDAAANRRRDETISKADELFGQRYIAVTGQHLRLYDKQTETGPPDEVIYWHGSSYVIKLIFAADGTIASLALLPEALLHTDNWSDVPDIAELSGSEMRWLVASANALQPLGKAGDIKEAPDGCFQSGRNLYCADAYESASVNHYHVELLDEKHVTNVVLRDIQIIYSQSVVGIVEDVRMEGSQRLLKVGGQWYHGEKPGVEVFSDTPKGAVVRLISFGCTANQKACIAIPEQSKSATKER